LNGTLNNHLAVDLVDDAVDLLQVVRIRDDLVVGEGILFKKKAGEGKLAEASQVDTRHAACDQSRVSATDREGGVREKKTHLEDNHLD
jgi:hypothetical protein